MNVCTDECTDTLDSLLPLRQEEGEYLPSVNHTGCKLSSQVSEQMEHGGLSVCCSDLRQIVDSEA